MVQRLVYVFCQTNNKQTWNGESNTENAFEAIEIKELKSQEEQSAYKQHIHRYFYGGRCERISPNADGKISAHN